MTHRSTMSNFHSPSLLRQDRINTLKLENIGTLPIKYLPRLEKQLSNYVIATFTFRSFFSLQVFILLNLFHFNLKFQKLCVNHPNQQKGTKMTDSN